MTDPAPAQGGELRAEMAWSIRPLTTADVITDALRLMRSDFWRLCGTVGVLVIPANVVIALSIYLFMKHMGRIPYLDPDVAMVGLGYYGVLLMGTATLWGLVVPFAQVALVRAITDRYLGRPVRIGAAYRWVAHNFWMVASTVVLVALVAGAGFMMFILPGFVAMLLLMLAIPVMVTEGRGGFYALQRSMKLVMANPGKLASLVVLAWLLSITVTSLPQMIVPQPQMDGSPSSTDELFAYYNVTALATAITTALAGITQSVIRTLRGSVYLLAYFDARCRAEGFDVEFEARKADVWGEPDAASAGAGGG